jgi:translation initiation factor 1A
MGKTKKHASLAQKRRNQERLHASELVTKDEMQTYGMVLRNLGDRRFLCKCSDGAERTCKIRGKFRGRLYVQLHDILLISLRPDEPMKADIIQKYRPEEVHELKKLGEFTERDFVVEGEEAGGAQAGPGDADTDVVWTTEEIDEI